MKNLQLFILNKKFLLFIAALLAVLNIFTLVVVLFHTHSLNKQQNTAFTGKEQDQQNTKDNIDNITQGSNTETKANGRVSFNQNNVEPTINDITASTKQTQQQNQNIPPNANKKEISSTIDTTPCEIESKSKNIVVYTDCNNSNNSSIVPILGYVGVDSNMGTPIQIRGKAKNIFENNLNFVVLDSYNNILDSGFITVNSPDFNIFGTFSKYIFLPNNASLLKLFHKSAATGEEINEDVITLNIKYPYYVSCVKRSKSNYIELQTNCRNPNQIIAYNDTLHIFGVAKKIHNSQLHFKIYNSNNHVLIEKGLYVYYPNSSNSGNDEFGTFSHYLNLPTSDSRLTLELFYKSNSTLSEVVKVNVLRTSIPFSCFSKSESGNVMVNINCNYGMSIAHNNLLHIYGKARNIYENNLNFVILDENNNILLGEDNINVNATDPNVHSEFSKYVLLPGNINTRHLTLKIFHRTGAGENKKDLVTTKILTTVLPLPCDIQSKSYNVLLSTGCGSYADAIFAYKEGNQYKITISGRARNIFENNLNFAILDNNNNVLLEDFVYVNSPDLGIYGDFSKTLIIPNSNTDMKLKIFHIFDKSEEDTIVVRILKLK
ncbi:MAG: Gmad2 immunoglobulin-like domain-containing protein [Candidatus Dojkabacteria bacterium]|nr:Gmad2 immunoglobulin-like domain-containing protein [Candidatus Dojkabacteria bacterium]